MCGVLPLCRHGGRVAMRLDGFTPGPVSGAGAEVSHSRVRARQCPLKNFDAVMYVFVFIEFIDEARDFLERYCGTVAS
jgi:hypothetical protein